MAHFNFHRGSVLVALLFSVSMVVSAQGNSQATKQETIDWLMSKLQKYVKLEYYTPDGTLQNVSYLFHDDGYLNYIQESYVAGNKHSHIIAVPIYAILDLRDGFIYTAPNKEMINFTCFSGCNPTSWKSSVASLLPASVMVELDIHDRIKKALLHAKTFYKAPVTMKERF